jgi:hypothetical protein
VTNSLEFVASRPAKVGDKLISTGFRNTVSRGFAALNDRNIAVCLLPGTELAFADEIKCDTAFFFSRRMGQKTATFRKIHEGQLSRHHDALEFSNGTTVLLLHLCENQVATVLQLPTIAPLDREVTEHNASLVASVCSVNRCVLAPAGAKQGAERMPRRD